MFAAVHESGYGSSRISGNVRNCAAVGGTSGHHARQILALRFMSTRPSLGRVLINWTYQAHPPLN